MLTFNAIAFNIAAKEKSLMLHSKANYIEPSQPIKTFNKQHIKKATPEDL